MRYVLIVIISVIFTGQLLALEAEAIKVEGKVSFKDSAKTPWMRLKAKMKLRKSAIIKTAEGAKATLKIGEISVISIHELTIIRLSKLSDTKSGATIGIDMKCGRVDNELKKGKGDETRMGIRTPAAVAAVRGTKYFVESNAKTKTARIGVWEGLVEVRSMTMKGQAKMVKPNYEIIVLYNKPLVDPIKMKMDEIRKEKEFRKNVQNINLVNKYTQAGAKMMEMNKMQTDKAEKLIKKIGLQKQGERIIREDFVKLKKAIARLYADTGYYPQIEGSPVKGTKGWTCLVKNEDKDGKKIRRWKGPYIDSDFKDPFGGTYSVIMFKTPKGNPMLKISSAGIDKVFGNKNDESVIYGFAQLETDAKEEKKNRRKWRKDPLVTNDKQPKKKK